MWNAAGQLVDRLGVLLERGVVGQDVERAELADRPLHRLPAERRVGDVAADQHAAPAFPAAASWNG